MCASTQLWVERRIHVIMGETSALTLRIEWTDPAASRALKMAGILRWCGVKRAALGAEERWNLMLGPFQCTHTTVALVSVTVHIHFSVGEGLCGWIWRNRVEKLTTVNTADWSLADNFYINTLRKCILLSFFELYVQI